MDFNRSFFRPMPTYDYRCLDCQRKFSKFLSYQEYDQARVTCPYCNSSQITRKIGKIRVARTSGERLAEMADPAALDQIEDDPRALGKMMREMKSELGAEMGNEFDEVVDRLDKGQTPDEIDQAFPDLGNENAL